MVDLFRNTAWLDVDQYGVECKVPATAEAEITISVHARYHDGNGALWHALHALLHLATERGWDFETALADARRSYEEEQIAIDEWEKLKDEIE